MRELLHKRVRDTFLHPQFNTDVMKPLSIEALLDQEVRNLSGGELQRVALVLALGTPADIYLIDEPSAYLDSEQRIIAAKVRSKSGYRCGLLLLAPARGPPWWVFLGARCCMAVLQSFVTWMQSVPSWAIRCWYTCGAAQQLVYCAQPCAGDQALHHARQEDGVHRGARLYHGRLPG